jgi:serine/threonine-protein kinase
VIDTSAVVEALPAYEVGGELGRGGWGIVLEGRHRQLGREVAIKQLPATFAADPDVRSRFLAEARLLASLDHPHIVPVYDFVDRDGLCLVVMEKLPGGTVWDRFVREGVSAELACGIGVVAAVGLEHAHRRGILHRDVKPENLMFSATGVLKVTDFGIAKVLSGGRTMATRAGDVLGTPAYMAPEQALGQEVGPGTDVYALGVMLYELLSGRLPFRAEDDSAMAVLFKHVHELPEDVAAVAVGVPAAVARVVMRALAKAPAERYQSAEAFGVALATAASQSFGPGWLARRGMTLMAGGPVLAAAESEAAAVGPSESSGSGSSVSSAGPTIVPGREHTFKAPVPAAPSDLVPAHEVRELQLLQRHRTGPSPFRADETDIVERLLGAQGASPAERLGLPSSAPADEVRAAAVAMHERWQRRAESPLASRDQADAARVLVRTCEGLLERLDR